MQRGCKKGRAETGPGASSPFIVGTPENCVAAPLYQESLFPPFFHPRRSSTVVWCYSPCNGCRRRRAERGDSSFFRGEAEQWWKQNHGIQRTKRKGPPHSQTIILQNFFVACEDLHSAERTGRFFPPPPYLHFQIPFVTANCPQAAEGGRKGEKKKHNVFPNIFFSRPLCVSRSPCVGVLLLLLRPPEWGTENLPMQQPTKARNDELISEEQLFFPGSLSVARRRKKEETST